MSRHSDKAALRGEPSYVWRSGQNRRLARMAQWGNLNGAVLDNGCGLGMYLKAIENRTSQRFGLEVEHDRAVQASEHGHVLQAVGEALPYADNSFDFIVSNEVIEHVQDDFACVREMVRTCKVGGRVMLFCPNRWNLFEQHGIYLGERYIFGNVPLINYFPDVIRDRLAPHVRVYTKRGLMRLFEGLPVKTVRYTRMFRGFDNVERRFGKAGRTFKDALYTLEATPLNIWGYSHLLVVEKV